MDQATGGLVAGRPRMPTAYGIATQSGGTLPWSWAEEQLRAARNYWVCSTRPDGRPHAMPVWGLWLDGAVLFSTDPSSRKGRNLAANPATVVHLESGDDVVIVEGRGQPMRDADMLARCCDAYEAKYAIRPEPDNQAQWFFAVRPTTVLGWRERDFPTSATRWAFAPFA